MNTTVILGYLKWSLDGMYINGMPLTDEQRDKLFDFVIEGLDYLTEDEAVEYFLNNSNTNIKEV